MTRFLLGTLFGLLIALLLFSCLMEEGADSVPD